MLHLDIVAVLLLLKVLLEVLLADLRVGAGAGGATGACLGFEATLRGGATDFLS